MSAVISERESLHAGTGFRRSSGRAFLFVVRFLGPHLKVMGLVAAIDISIVLITLAVPWFGKAIIDRAFPQRDVGLAMTIAASVAGLLLLVQLLTGARTYLYNLTELRLMLDLRRKMYGHVQKLSLETVETIPIGQMQFRIGTDSDRIAHMLVRIIPTATMFVEFTLVVTATVIVDRTIALVALAFLIPWTALFVGVTAIGRTLDRRRLRRAELRDAGILQAAASFATIKSMGREARERKRNGRANIELQRVAAQGYLILVFFEVTTQKILPFLKTTTVYLMLARKVILGEMTVGLTVPMIAYLNQMTRPLERIVNFGCWIWQTMVSAERMMQFLQTRPAISDAPNAERLPTFTGRLKFDNVSFDRPEVGRILHGIDLEIAPGDTVAVVGPSGAGKSTLLGLALRLIDPTEGAVRADGHDLREVRSESYLRQVGTVLQETFLFDGTLAQNLRPFAPDATDAELRRVLSDVELDQWLATLPDGLEEDLKGGSALSAGQRQRLGIARAILADAPLLLLDEPTSALDARTTREIMTTLRRIARGTAGKGRAVMLVTHRMDTLEPTDEIVVLEAGRIVQRGHHADLIAQAGLYARLCELYRNDVARAEEVAERDAHESGMNEETEVEREEVFMPPTSNLGGVIPGVTN